MAADGTLRKELIDAIEVTVASGIMSKSNHGNMSLRLPGTDTFFMTGVSSFSEVVPDPRNLKVRHRSPPADNSRPAVRRGGTPLRRIL